MSKVILINPPYLFKKDGSYVPFKGMWKPVGILYLATILEMAGISTKVIDLIPHQVNLNDVLLMISKEKPILIGITGTTPQIKGIVQLGKAIKKKFGKKIILGLGGPEASNDTLFLKSFPFFDFIFIGEGETTFPELVKKVIEGEKIKKIIYGETPKNLDKLPFPKRELLDSSLYAGPYGENFVNMHTSRGCPFDCIYCSKIIKGDRTVRFRSSQSVLAEIEECVKKYKTEFFIFTDDTFTLNRERVKKICHGIIKKKFSIKWNCETRAGLVDKELLKLMKKAGCTEIYFGVETGSERIRNQIINKRVTDKELEKAFNLCRQIGITTNAFLMAGFPTETRKELQETFNFPFKIKPDIIGVHLTSILPGSPIFDTSIKEKRIKKTVWHDYALGKIKTQPLYIPQGMTLKDLENFQKKLYRKFYFRPIWLTKRVASSLKSWSQFKDDVNIALRLLFKGNSRARCHKEEDYF